MLWKSLFTESIFSRVFFAKESEDLCDIGARLGLRKCIVLSLTFQLERIFAALVRE
jgi:hypothetical protein